MEAIGGTLYGTTASGGKFGFGVIFSFDLSNHSYKKLKDFKDVDGIAPECTLVQTGDGKLYGTTMAGGKHKVPYPRYPIGAGVIFSFDPSGSNYKKLAEFDTTNGANPSGSLVLSKNGKLYGTTDQGGSSKAGVIFSFDPSYSRSLTKLVDFDYINGAHPYLGSAFIEIRDYITSATYYLDADGDGYGHPNKLSIAGHYEISNYPNPFVGTSTIRYELPFDSKVSIKVYDLMGRVVATLVDENKKAGTYTIDFNAGHVSRGSLYYRIIATSKDKQFKLTNKMIQIQ